jgi:hypothetical protein
MGREFGAAGPAGPPPPPPAQPAVSSAPAAAPLDPERLAVAKEVIALAFPPERREAMFARIGDAMMDQVRAAIFGSMGVTPNADVEAMLQRYFERLRAQNRKTIAAGSPPLFDAMARAYARAFTRDELIQIRAFVATPAGAKYIQRSSDLLSDPDVAQANTVYMQQVFEDSEPLRADFEREIAAYFAKHPPQRH